MGQPFRQNESVFKMNEPESNLFNQSCDIPLPPPPPHILAMSATYETFGAESPYLMPPPPSIIGHSESKPDVPDFNSDSVVPPPMPIINPPPRQHSLSTSKCIQPSSLAFPTIQSSVSSPAIQIINSTASSSNTNSSKSSKASPPIAVPPRISSFVTSAKFTRSNDNNLSNQIVSILKQRSLPPLQLGNKPILTCPSVQSANSNIPNSAEISGLSTANSKEIPLCSVCGQFHDVSGNHIYFYTEAVVAELRCQLCNQPLVDPLETKCGHTFCAACLKSRLAVQAICPEDKQIINYLECSPASNIVKRLLDKLMISCPKEGCDEVMSRCDLEAHLLYWCHFRHQNSGASKHLLTSNKWDSGFDKSPHTTSTSVTLSSTNSSVPLNDPSGSSTAVNTCDDALPMSSSSSENTSNNSNNTNRGSGTSNHKNSVRFESAPQSRRKYCSTNEEPDFCSGSLTTIVIDRTNNSDLGISFVGGYDTPLQCIIIQEVYLDGAIAKDGRLRPGDQIVSINDIDLNQATHLQARSAFLQIQQQSVCRLTVYRERVDESLAEKEEILQFCLSKRAEKKLGIKLVGQKNKPGLYVLDLVKGSEAEIDGRLRKNDRILSINGVDLKLETQDTAARVINNAEGEVRIIISRIIRPQTPDLIRTTGSELLVESFEPFNQGNNLSPPPGVVRKTNGSWQPFEKVVTVEKNYGESLGMSVAGGVNSQRGDTPVYVTNLSPDGVLAKTQQVFKGDILLAVNDTELLGLSHERAVDALKLAGQKFRKVCVRLLQGPETSKNGGQNFLPSWIYWLQLPRFCEIPRAIKLKRESPTASLGFSIVGGTDNSQTSPGRYPVNGRSLNVLHNPIVVKSIVAGSVAHRNGKLKCGDILLTVNHISLVNVTHDYAVSLFKNVQEEVNLEVVSWPGTIV